MKMTQGSTSMCWSLTFQGSSWLVSTKNWPDFPEIVQQHIVVFYQKVRLLKKLRDSGSNVNAYDKETFGKEQVDKCT